MRATEGFIVVKPGQVIRTTGNLNLTTGAINLADGQMGMVNDGHFGTVAMNTFLGATPTIDEAPVIKLYQGTPYSASPGALTGPAYPLWNRPYESTARINGRGQVDVTRQDYRAPKHNCWVVGNGADTLTGTRINVVDNEEYQMYVGFSSVRTGVMFSSTENVGVRASITTPNFTALATPEPIDWITTNMGWILNRHSAYLNSSTRFRGNSPFVALQLAAAGGTLISGLTAGTFLPIVTSAAGVRGITLTAEMVTSIQAAVAAHAAIPGNTAFTSILTIDLATAGTTVGGIGYGLMLMAMPERLVYQDRTMTNDVRLEVALPLGFDYQTVGNVEATPADPGQGLGWVLDRWYRNTQGQRKYSNYHHEDPYVQFPSPVDPLESYIVFNIMHVLRNQNSQGPVLTHPHQEIVLIPNSAVAVADAFAGQLNAWLASGDNQPVKVEDN